MIPFDTACKPRAQWRMGLEYETFLFHESFDRRANGAEIQALLKSWCDTQNTPLMEGDHIIGVNLKEGALSLEPGGQFEFAAPPVASVAEVSRLFHAYRARIVPLAQAQHLKVISMGADPKEPLDKRFWMDKDRYKIMRPYMESKDTLGTQMMTGTCTTQINLDYASEQDMVRKFRVALALQPLATALFASSPLSLGKPNGFQSYRSHIWQHTDKERCGILPFVFEEGMGFERYVDYALDVPMYFVRRDKKYINVAGRSFRHFLKGELRELPGQKPTPQDWQDHLTTLFPEVRLKNVLELRGMDSGPCPQPSAMAALWTGLLYDDEALAQCTDFIVSWTQGDMNALYEKLPKEGLDARVGKMSLYDVAKIILPWARQGHLRQEKNILGASQTPSDYLAPLFKIVETKRTPADCLLDLFHQSGSVTNFLEKIALSNPII